MFKINLKQIVVFILTVFVIKIAIADPMRIKKKKTPSTFANQPAAKIHTR